ncbi:MAG TPA: 30S ribosomal protein S9 [Candidatus Saccharimonadales bacterium]|nr:30S ribosomal protein S9 [Candidatus Saccharimonadales bacterium]
MAEEKKETKQSKKTESYKAVGRRKQAVARVWLKLEKGPILVNDKPMEEYFSYFQNKKLLEEPFRTVNRIDQMSGTIRVAGGGATSQAEAVVHGISRALIKYDETFRSALAKKKLLTRDSRVKERRKYGYAGKARKQKQSPKR